MIRAHIPSRIQQRLPRGSERVYQINDGLAGLEQLMFLIELLGVSDLAGPGWWVAGRSYLKQLESRTALQPLHTSFSGEEVFPLA